MTTGASSIRLPITVAIGFTGHRSLPDEDKSRKLIYGFLKDKKETIPGMVYGVSSAAAGGDLIFAESCIQLEIPLRILLPMPQGQFRADFDAATWMQVQEVVKKAVSVEVTGGDQSRDERYYECGIETVHQSRLLLALWNGEPARGLGGTENILEFARQLGRPVVWIHSSTGETRVFNENAAAALTRDPELDFLNELPEPKEESEAKSPEALASAWFKKVDESATRFAPEVRQLASIPIICTAAAAIVSGAGSWAPGVDAWIAVGAVLGILAALLPPALKLQKRQVLWARTRTAAEVCRSVLAFWYTPASYEVIGPDIVPELSGMLMSLNLLKAIDPSRKSDSLEEFKERYRKERVSHQIAYFSRHARKSARDARLYRIGIWTCVSFAILMSVYLFLGAARVAGFGARTGDKWIALAVSILFQLATIAGALLVVNDSERRERRYAELYELLTDWDAQLEALRTWPSVLRVAGSIEKALLVELLEWRSLTRNVKIPGE